MNDTILEIRHLSKAFGSHKVLRDIDFSVAKGDVTSIIGASGSGKSTLLRCINLLETPSSGEILYHGKNVAAGQINAAAYRSRVGMVFQSFNLFNNMTVLENCMVGEMAFARDVSSQVVYMNEGVICEQGAPEQLFHAPQRQETREFLSRFRQN